MHAALSTTNPLALVVKEKFTGPDDIMRVAGQKSAIVVATVNGLEAKYHTIDVKKTMKNWFIREIGA